MSQRPKKQISGKTVKRLMSYITDRYKVQFFIVFICIITSAVANVAGSVFIQTLIDDYIEPLLLEDNPLFTGLLRAILMMGVVYLIGIIATLLYNRMMVTISQGVLKKIRDDMFAHMQTLPIKYFDSHNHGDVMSYYTNDTDALRQMISQSIPQAFSSIITIAAVTCAMFILSPFMTLLVFVCVFIMLIVVKKIGGKSSGYFIKQQSSLGDVNGYIEEMINGQRW